MSIMLKIWKAKLRSRYVAYSAACNRLDCGHALSDHITGGEIERLRKEVNDAVAQCKALDPTCTLQPIR